MNKQDLFQLVGNVLGVDPEDITTESDLYEDLNAEPKDIIELKLQLEDELKTEFDEDEFNELETIGELIDLIEENSNEYFG